MANKQTKKSNNSFWFMVGLTACLLGAPTAMLTKIITNTGLDAFAFSTIRYGVMMAFLLIPALVGLIKYQKVIRKNWKPMLAGGICLGLSGVAYTVAIALGQASHVNIINLLTPIVLVILSAKIIHDKVSHSARVGIILAAIGGILVVAMPMIASGSVESSFHPGSVALALANCLLYPISMVFTRRSNEKGVPLSLILVISCMTIILISTALGPLFYGMTVADHIPNMSTWDWLLLVGYCGIISALIARIMTVRAYEHVGAAVSGGFEYLHTLVAIILPIIVLHEKLSPEIMIGAVFILLGIYMTESHHSMNKHAHWHLLRKKAGPK